MSFDVQPGIILAGKYRLTSLIGQGGMGSVWRADHLDLSAPVAVKLIDPVIADKPESLARFHREAKAAAALRSQHVVQVFDHGIDPATKAPFIVMELLEGESLAERLARTTLSWPEVADIITQVGRALSRAHAAGILHRDLKPDNVFLVHNDDHDVAKVVDFGIAKADWLAVGGASTATGTVLGTAYYMSPEQLRGTKEVNHRSDLWALGVIAHECITRVHPFTAETLPELVFQICMNDLPVPSSTARVPPGFDEWFLKALARKPELRFQSAKELAEALREVCAADNPATVRHVVWASEPPLSPAAQQTRRQFEAAARTELMPDKALRDVIPETERVPSGAPPFATPPASLTPATALAERSTTGASSATPSHRAPSRNGGWLWLGGFAAVATASAVGFMLLKSAPEANSADAATAEPLASSNPSVDVLALPDSLSTDTAIGDTNPTAPAASEAPAVVAGAADTSGVLDGQKRGPGSLPPNSPKPATTTAGPAPTGAATAAPPTAESKPSPVPYDSLGLPAPEQPPAPEPAPSKPPSVNLDDVLDTRR